MMGVLVELVWHEPEDLADIGSVMWFIGRETWMELSVRLHKNPIEYLALQKMDRSFPLNKRSYKYSTGVSPTFQHIPECDREAFRESIKCEDRPWLRFL